MVVVAIISATSILSPWWYSLFDGLDDSIECFLSTRQKVCRNRKLNRKFRNFVFRNHGVIFRLLCFLFALKNYENSTVFQITS